jgi:hypothetical protein
MRHNAEVNDHRKAELDARWREFWHDYKDFDSSWSRNVLHNLGEFLPWVFDGMVPALKQLYEGSGVPSNLLEHWADDWTDAAEWIPATALRGLRIFRLDLAVRAYAYYGLKLKVDEPHDFWGLDSVLDDWDCELGSTFPRDWCAEEEKRAIMAALARRKLDEPKHGETITPDELAALARVSRKSIFNLLAPSNRSLVSVDRNGEHAIDIESARSWLRARSDFRPSVWQHQENAISPPLLSEALQVAEPIFVPVANDAVWFSPGHRTQRKSRPRSDRDHRDHGVYYVANGDHEESHEDYWKALDFLNSAELPRWRYSDGGQLRTKNANGWIRKSRHEIEALLNEGNKRHATSKA